VKAIISCHNSNYSGDSSVDDKKTRYGNVVSIELIPVDAQNSLFGCLYQNCIKTDTDVGEGNNNALCVMTSI
jgi:hypothetical protein